MKSRHNRVRVGVLAAVVVVISVAGWATAQQVNSSSDPKVVRGSGTAGTIPLWTGKDTLGNSSITQTGNDQSINGSLSVNGNLALPNAAPNAGVISIGGTPVLYTVGRNIFLGPSAGNVITTGLDNTATGDEALDSITNGAENTAMGSHALFLNTTGNSNTAIGSNALLVNTTGEFNTATGWDTLDQNTTGGNNTADGAGALCCNTTGFFNTASGYSALNQNTTGSNNTAIGGFALSFNHTGSSNTALGSDANVSQVNLNNATAIGAGAIVDASNKIRLGNTSVSVIEGQVPYTFTSDRNQKENFQPVDGEQVLRKIGNLSLTSWNYIGHNPKQYRHYGPVAQEFFAAFGHDEVGTIGTDTTINSGDMEGILMIAVQALEKQNAELKTRMEALERTIKGLQAAASQSAK